MLLYLWAKKAGTWSYQICRFSIPENNWDQKISDVQDYKIDTFVMGSDWEGKFDFLKDYCEVVYLPRTEGISTTQIKEDLNKKDMTAKGDK